MATTRPRNSRSLAAEAAFRARLAELGATLLEPAWLGALQKHRVRCSEGHDLCVRPNDIRGGKGICRRCASRRVNSARTLRAEAEFRERLAKLGATPLYQAWRGVDRPHDVRCAAGHSCCPRPSGLQQGEGICRICANNDPATAEAAFRERLAELGATPLFEKWLGSGAPHHVICAAGHDCRPRPRNAAVWGICRTCAGKDPAMAEAKFLARLADLGCTPLYETYSGRNSPHYVRCAAGHDCWPRPDSIISGRGACPICARRDPATAEAAFRARVAELGGTVLGEYRNANAKIHVRCAAGHDSYPRPNDVRQGIGICLSCSGLDPAIAEAGFRARLLELGAAPLYGIWRGSGSPHHVRCAAGHDCWPTPGNVRGGQGVCRSCAGGEWDAFYVVVGADVVKFGITTGDPRPRLRRHALDGYTEVVRLAIGLHGTGALDTEDAVKSALALAGEKPVRGREYFDRSCLALVLDVADSWLAEPVSTSRTWMQEALFTA